MSFLYPQFLFALFALAVPLIIHLFNFRRYKKIFFTNVRFLTDIQKESKSKNKLRHLILLLMRLLALACIIIAFAQPFFPHKKSLINPGRNNVAIYVDNSFSMSNVNTQGELLQNAKVKAEEIAQAYRESDGFMLITNDLELKHQRWVNKAEFKQMLNEVAASPASRKFTEINTRIKENFRKAETGNKFVYFISDYQQNTANLGKIEKDTSIIMNAVPLQAAAQNNIYIDSVWFEGAILQLNQSNTLLARIKNASSNPVEEGTLTLHINNKQKAIANFSIAANEYTDVKITFTITENGYNKSVLSINDFPITFDDTYYFSFKVSKFVPVLCINGEKPNPFIERAFSAEKAFQFQQLPQGNIDYSTLKNYKFIILNEAVNLSSGLASAFKDFVDNGGNLLVVPTGQEGNINSYNQFLAAFGIGGFSGLSSAGAAVTRFDINNPFFQNIFEDIPRDINLPEAKKYYRFTSASRTMKDILLPLANGDAFLSMFPSGKGNIFITAAPFNGDWSNFINHALFLPVLYKMALFKSQADRISYTIGTDNYLQVPISGDVKEQVYRLKKDKFEVIPPQRMLEGNLNFYVEGLIKDAGHYTLDLNEKTAASQEVYSFNFDRKESEMKFLTEEQITDSSGSFKINVLDVSKASLTTEIKNIQQGSQLWKWFIIAALLFLVAETLIIRFWK